MKKGYRNLGFARAFSCALALLFVAAFLPLAASATSQGLPNPEPPDAAGYEEYTEPSAPNAPPEGEEPAKPETPPDAPPSDPGETDEGIDMAGAPRREIPQKELPNLGAVPAPDCLLTIHTVLLDTFGQPVSVGENTQLSFELFVVRQDDGSRFSLLGVPGEPVSVRVFAGIFTVEPGYVPNGYAVGGALRSSEGSMEPITLYGEDETEVTVVFYIESVPPGFRQLLLGEAVFNLRSQTGGNEIMKIGGAPEQETAGTPAPTPEQETAGTPAPTPEQETAEPPEPLDAEG